MKKREIIIVAIALVLVLSVNFAFGAVASTDRYDINGDGIVNISDVTVLLNYLAETGAGTADDPDVVNVNSLKDSTLHAGDLCKVNKSTQPQLESSYRDDNYYYYIYDLGMINNVPLTGFSDLFKYQYCGQETTVTIESSEAETSSIYSSVQSTVQNQVSISASFGIKFGMEVGEKDAWKFSAEMALNAGYTNVDTISSTESYTQASDFSKSKKKTTTMKFDQKAENGYYGYILTGALRVYALVVYDINTDSYSVDYINKITEYWTDFYYFKTSDEFVYYQYETIDFTIPSDLPVPDNYVIYPDSEIQPITVAMKRFNCADGSNYNKSVVESNETARSRHNGFEIGELVIFGCKENGNRYIVADRDSLSIKYRILQNTEDLPRVGTNNTRISSDSANVVTGIAEINQRIGCGAYWIRVTYTDKTQECLVNYNQFEKKYPDTYIEFLNADMLNPQNSDKSIEKIEVVIVYEVCANVPGVLWSVNENTNWRCEYTFDFMR